MGEDEGCISGALPEQEKTVVVGDLGRLAREIPVHTKLSVNYDSDCTKRDKHTK